MHVLEPPNNFTFEKVGIKGKVFPVKNITNKSGITYVETETGHKTTIVNHVCDVYYYIIEGEGYFEINDNKENYNKGDLVVVPAESKFTYKGKCKMLRVTTPAFYPEQEDTLN